jgi:hypothetical protein
VTAHTGDREFTFVCEAMRVNDNEVVARNGSLTNQEELNLPNEWNFHTRTGVLVRKWARMKEDMRDFQEASDHDEDDITIEDKAAGMGTTSIGGSGAISIGQAVEDALGLQRCWPAPNVARRQTRHGIPPDDSGGEQLVHRAQPIVDLVAQKLVLHVEGSEDSNNTVNRLCSSRQVHCGPRSLV